MNWSQIPPWLWALMPLAAFLIYVLRQRPIAANPWSERRFASRRTVGMNEWPQRSVSAPPAANDPYLQLHQEILRGLLRKEGIVLPPPDEPRRPEPAHLAVPQWYKIVPTEAPKPPTT